MMNPVVHFEMPYRDAAHAARFYTAAFGWQTQLLGEEMGDHLLVTTALSDVKARPRLRSTRSWRAPACCWMPRACSPAEAAGESTTAPADCA
jgi:hypothetical protein